MINQTNLIIIVALLPLTAGMLLFQVNPFHGLVIRGVLGAIAAWVEAILGAADVALTEALVGTLLAITLYAITVRSSMVMRLGVGEEMLNNIDGTFKELINDLRPILAQYHLRLECIPYGDLSALQQALRDKEVHGLYFFDPDQQTYQTMIRVRRLYDLIEQALGNKNIKVIYNPSQMTGDTH